jgi:hypothetical protein
MTTNDMVIMCSISALDKSKLTKVLTNRGRQNLIKISTKELVAYLIRLIEKSNSFYITKKEKETLLPILQNYLKRFRFFYFRYFSKKYPMDIHLFSPTYINTMAIKALYLLS